MVFRKIKDGFSRVFKNSTAESDYVEIDLGQEAKKTRIQVRPFVLRQFEDINEILNTLREGYSIAIVDIKPLKTKDVIELKRAISKLKKTAEALEGSIAGFGENTIIVTPSFAEIYKAPIVSKIEGLDNPKLDTY